MSILSRLLGTKPRTNSAEVDFLKVNKLIREVRDAMVVCQRTFLNDPRPFPAKIKQLETKSDRLRLGLEDIGQEALRKHTDLAKMLYDGIVSYHDWIRKQKYYVTGPSLEKFNELIVRRYNNLNLALSSGDAYRSGFRVSSELMHDLQAKKVA